jgi:pimeloyl-ACP methyl ester carboxylesterase
MPPLHDEIMKIAHSVDSLIWIYGEDDLKYREIAQEVQLRCDQGPPPGSTQESAFKIISIDGTGHAPHLEDLEAFWDVLRSLLSAD